MSESRIDYWSRQTLREKQAEILWDWRKDKDANNDLISDLQKENEQLKYFKSEAIDRLECTCEENGHHCCNCLFIGKGHCKGEDSNSSEQIIRKQGE